MKTIDPMIKVRDTRADAFDGIDAGTITAYIDAHRADATFTAKVDAILAASDLNAAEPAYIDPYPNNIGSDYVEVPCWKCGGYGKIDAFDYNENGRCFKCDGHGHYPVRVSTARRNARAAFNFDHDMWEVNHGPLAELSAQVDVALAAIKKDAAEKAAKEAATRAAAIAAKVEKVAATYTAGERMKNVDATITRTTTFSRPTYTGFGPDELCAAITFTLADGTSAVWFSGSDAALSLASKAAESPITGKLTATVKGVGDFAGKPQVKLTRAKFTA